MYFTARHLYRDCVLPDFTAVAVPGIQNTGILPYQWLLSLLCPGTTNGSTIGTAGPPGPRSKTRGWRPGARGIGMVIYLNVFPDLEGGFLMTEVVVSEDQRSSSMGWEQSLSPKRPLERVCLRRGQKAKGRADKPLRLSPHSIGCCCRYVFPQKALVTC